MIRPSVALLLIALACLGAPGCASIRHDNPAFPLTHRQAEGALDAMADEPAPLVRPVLVLGGWGDPGIAIGNLFNELKDTTSTPELMTEQDFFWTPSIEAAREQAIRHALRTIADGDEDVLYETVFDIVGFSMGGLVARAIAAPSPDPGAAAPLRVRRIITISTPHRGAKAAVLPTLDRKVLAMRPGSPFLKRMDEALGEAEYLLICYVRLGDGIVGPENASPDGHPVHWVRNPVGHFAHSGAGSDPRIVASIARLLRGEPAYIDPRGTPLPDDG